MKSGKPAGYYTGESRGQYVRRAPIQVTDAVLETGRERYNIYCSVCHDQTGSGNGTVVQRGYLRPPHLADERLVDSPDGYIYDVIANGVRNMPAYGNKISEADRWAIVMYVRALQRLDGVPMSEVPAEYRGRLK
jgi:mono/diheme cytochrome c family protein